MKKSTKISLAGAAVAAGVAGAYYFFGTEKGKKQRLQVQDWMKQAEEEIITEAYKLKDVAFNKGNYTEIVEAVTAKYAKLKKLDKEQMAKFSDIVTGAWGEVKDLVRDGTSDNKKEIRDAVNKVSKAVSKSIRNLKADIADED